MNGQSPAPQRWRGVPMRRVLITLAASFAWALLGIGAQVSPAKAQPWCYYHPYDPSCYWWWQHHHHHDYEYDHRHPHDHDYDHHHGHDHDHEHHEEHHDHDHHHGH